jgi:hypothetical protein
MKVVKDTTKLTIKVRKSELFDGKYLYYNKVSEKLKEFEESDNMQFKALRNKFYNSSFGGKYNITSYKGLKCINVLEPMKAKASLELTFEVEG